MTWKFWQWPSIIRGQDDALDEAVKAQSDLSGKLAYSEDRWTTIHASNLVLKEEADKAKLEAQLAAESREELAKMLGESSREIEGLKTEIANSTNDLLRSQLESEKLKAELEKAQHALERSALATEAEKAKHEKTKVQLVKTAEWVFKTHRLVIPPTNGIRGHLARLSLFLLLLLPVALFAALPPPTVGNSWSTNRPPMPVEGQDNLSVTNLGSTTNWQFFNVGPKTIARLSDVTNIASSFSGDAGGTNSRQFGSLNLTNWSNIPTGAMANVVSTTFLTNWANSISNYVTASTNSASVTNWINSRQPASANLTNWSLIPTGAMANVVSTDFLTNWANSISNLTATKQNGSAVLTNLVGTVARNVTNVVSLSTTNATSKPLTNSYTSGVLTIFGMEQGSGHMLTMNASNIVSANDWVQTASTTNVVGLSNWVNAVSNYVTSATNSASVTNWINSRQPADAVLSNLVGTVARNVTNVVSLSTTNATSKPLTNSYTSGVLTIFGLETGTGITLTPNGSNIVIAGTVTGAATNANQFGAQTVLTIKDGAFLTNVIAIPTGGGTAPALTVTNTPGMGTNSFQILNTNGNAVIFASTNAGITLVSSNSLVLGTQTNASSENITGGVTNWAGTELKGTAFASSNLLVKAGQSTSNAWVGGTVFVSTGNFTNLNGVPGTLTNLANCSVPAHTLTNNGDMLRAFWGGVGANAMQNTQNFQIVYGAVTILDTGLQISSNILFNARVTITRTGGSTEHAEAQFEWLPKGLGATGLPWASTNVNAEIAANNGVANTLALKGSAQRVGAHTNNSFRVWYEPAPN